MEFKPRNEPGVVEYQFFYGNCLLAGLQPQQLRISQRALTALLLDSDALEANADRAAAQAAQLAQQLLQLDPTVAEEVG